MTNATRIRVYGVAILLAASICSVTEAQIQLAQSGKARAVIVENGVVTENEKAAAKDLKDILKRVTGATFESIDAARAADRPSRIFVGDSPTVRKLLPDVRWDTLEADEIIISTVGRDLILAGGRPRGTVNAVYTFLQDIVGCRWWTRDAAQIPSKPNLAVPKVTIQYRPQFEMRFVRGEIGSWPDARRWLRLTFDHHFDPATHSVDQLLPRDNFLKHPDWFMYAKEDGDPNHEHSYLYALNAMKAAGNKAEYEVAKRTRRLPRQPCLHSQGACQTITDGVMAKLASDYASWQHPPKIVWVTQSDGGGSICTCPKCEAVQRKEGSDSANWLRLVNEIAEQVEKKYPDVMVGMFAYLHTEFPPKTVKPRHNVLIYSALLRNNKLDSVARYKAHADGLKTWATMAKRLYVWDYDANYPNFFIPHPNYFAMGESLSFFKEIGVDGVMVQSSWGEAADMQPMRTWMNAQMMWNPDQDPRKLMKEFLDGYYGTASPFLMKYLESLSAAAHRKKGAHLGCFNNDTRGWLTLKDLNTANQLFDQAANAVKDDKTLTGRVWLARRAIDFAWLDRYDEFKLESKKTGVPFLEWAKPDKVLDELAPYRNAWGPYRTWKDFRVYYDALRERFPR